MKMGLGLRNLRQVSTGAAAPSIPSDNFNAGSLNAQWSTSLDMFGSAFRHSSTGMTFNVSGGTLNIVNSTGTAARDGIVGLSADTNLDTFTQHYIHFTADGGVEDQGMIFGTPGDGGTGNSNVVAISYASSQIQVYTLVGGTFTAVVTYNTGAPTPTNTPYFRLRRVTGSPGRLQVDKIASGGASNPPLNGEWTQIIDVAWPTGVPTSGKIAFYQRNTAGAAVGATTSFDGFNTSN